MDCLLFIKYYGSGTMPRLCFYSADILDDFGQQVEIKLDYGTKEEVLNNILGVVSMMRECPTHFSIIKDVPINCSNKKQLDETIQSLTSDEIVAYLTEAGQY